LIAIDEESERFKMQLIALLINGNHLIALFEWPRCSPLSVPPGWPLMASDYL